MFFIKAFSLNYLTQKLKFRNEDDNVGGTIFLGRLKICRLEFGLKTIVK